MTLTLYQKRKTEALQGRKLPEKLRVGAVSFAELANAGLEYCNRNNAGYDRSEKYRIKALKDQFGSRNAESIMLLEAMKEFKRAKQLENAERQRSAWLLWREAHLTFCKDYSGDCCEECHAPEDTVLEFLHGQGGSVMYLCCAKAEEQAALQNLRRWHGDPSRGTRLDKRPKLRGSLGAGE